MNSTSSYQFPNVLVLRYEWGLAAYVGTEWHVFEDNLLARSIAVKSGLNVSGFQSTIYPLLRNRVGPFLDWLNTASQSVIKIAGADTLNTPGSEFRKVLSQFLKVEEAGVQIVDHLSFNVQPSTDRVLVVLSGSSMLFFNNANDASDLILRAKCTSRVAGFVRDARMLFERSQGRVPVFVTHDKLKEYGEWCRSRGHSWNDAPSIGLIEGSAVNLSSEYFAVDEAMPRVNPLVGPIRFSSTKQRGDLFLSHAWESHKTLESARVETRVKVEAGALKADPSDAECVAKWEAWERFCIRGPNRGELTTCSAKELTPSVLAYLQEGLYSDRQYETPGFPYRRIDLSDYLTCTNVVDCDRGEVVAMPADLLWLTNLDGIVQSTSNGAATYSDYGSATLRGLLELVERHVFLKIWHSGYPVIKYRIESLPREIKTLAGEFPSNLDVSLIVAKFSAGNFTVFCSYVSLRARSFFEGPSCILGAGAGFSIIESISSAIEECLRGNHYFESVYDDIIGSDSPEPKCLVSPFDHVSWHWVPGRQSHSRVLFDHPFQEFPAKIEWPCYDAEEAFRGIVTAITHDFGGKIWARQMAPPGCECSSPVVRVIASDLIPFYFGPYLVRNPQKYRLKLWNLAPHPFP